MISTAQIEAFCNRILLEIKYENASLEAAVQAAAQGLSEENVNDIRAYLTTSGSEAKQLSSFPLAWRTCCDRFGIVIEGPVQKVIADALPR